MFQLDVKNQKNRERKKKHHGINTRKMKEKQREPTSVPGNVAITFSLYVPKRMSGTEKVTCMA